MMNTKRHTAKSLPMNLENSMNGMTLSDAAVWRPPLKMSLEVQAEP